MNRLAKLIALLSCLMALSSSAEVASTNPVVPPPAMHIVMCRKDADMDSLIKGFGLKPKFVYRKLHGFAAPLTEAAIQGLKKHPRVLSVEPDGVAVPCGQVIPSGLVRIGDDHFPVAHINGTPKSLNVDVAVMDTGIDPHVDLPPIDPSHFFCPW